MQITSGTTSTPPPLTPLGSVFDDRVELLGVDLDPPRPQGGDTVSVRFVFRVRRPLFDDFQVFVHGDPSGQSTRRLFAAAVSATAGPNSRRARA